MFTVAGCWSTTLDTIPSNALTTVVQPIVKLSNAEHVGYEALARNESGSLLRNPETLFRYAEQKHRLADLEIVCIANSLRESAALPPRSPSF